MASKAVVNTFRSLIKELGSGDEQELKVGARERIAQFMPVMKSLAKQQDGDALYWLAQLCPKGTGAYVKLMSQSATAGNLRAAVDLIEFFSTQGGLKALGRAVALVGKVQKSTDSFMMAEVDNLLETNPRLQRALNAQSTASGGNFFTSQSSRTKNLPSQEESKPMVMGR